MRTTLTAEDVAWMGEDMRERLTDALAKRARTQGLTAELRAVQGLLERHRRQVAERVAEAEELTEHLPADVADELLGLYSPDHDSYLPKIRQTLELRGLVPVG